MGTRSLTYLYETEETNPFLCIYNQWDGYITGLGKDLSVFINSKEMVNGYSNPETQFNGMGCLATQLIVHMKEGKEEAGGTYIMAPNTNDVSEDYVYHIWPEKVRAVSVWDDKTLFEGPWEEFLSFCLQYGLEEEEKI